MTRSVLLAALLAGCGPTLIGTITFEITPEAPMTGDDITITAIVPQPAQTFDLTATHEGAEVRFTRADAEEAAEGFGRRFSVTLPASETAKGQVWTLSAVAADGRKEQRGSFELPIVNTPPTVQVSIAPTEARRSEVLTATATATDTDGDEVTVSYRWLVNGDETEITGPEFPALTARRNDVVTVIAVGNDGESDGPEGTDQVTLRNSPPTVEVALTPERPNTATPLIAIATGDDADGDALTYSFSWWVNGEQVSPTTEELGTQFYTREDVVEVSAVARDGRTISSPATASTTILNSPPSTPEITINNRDGEVSSFSDIHCRMTTPSFDADRDPITYTFSWYRNDTLYTGPVETLDHPGDLLPYTETEEGETWWCSVSATDGTDTSDIAISPEVDLIATLEYRIGLSGLVNIGTDCGSGGHRYGTSGNFGVSWTDAGSIRPRRLRIQYQMGVNCTGPGSRTAFINDRVVGTTPSGDDRMCTCTPTTYVQDETFDVPDTYVPGGRNTFTMSRSSSDGWSSNADWRDGSTDIWAIVTVEY